MANLEERLTAVASLCPKDLRQEWERVHRTPAPRISPELLKMGIAYRLQEKEHGGLPRKTVTLLRSEVRSRPSGPALKPGTRLVRSWNGRTVSVEVANEGLLFENRRYTSLSAIAREVTGANWSGPRFFGLTGSARHG